jgi:hypothetical protein
MEAWGMAAWTWRFVAVEEDLARGKAKEALEGEEGEEDDLQKRKRREKTS